MKSHAMEWLTSKLCTLGLLVLSACLATGCSDQIRYYRLGTPRGPGYLGDYPEVHRAGIEHHLPNLRCVDVVLAQDPEARSLTVFATVRNFGLEASGEFDVEVEVRLTNEAADRRKTKTFSSLSGALAPTSQSSATETFGPFTGVTFEANVLAIVGVTVDIPGPDGNPGGRVRESNEADNQNGTDELLVP
jgi:hypothetical protein